MDRNKKSRETQKIETNAYNLRMRAAYLDSFVKHKLAGNYHATRCNALLSQIDKKEFGMWNGIVYTEECLSAEYWLAKHSAIKAFAAAQVAEQELLKVGLSKEEVYAHFKKFQDSELFSPDYSEFRDDADDTTAHFVDENNEKTEI